MEPAAFENVYVPTLDWVYRYSYSLLAFKLD